MSWRLSIHLYSPLLCCVELLDWVQLPFTFPVPGFISRSLTLVLFLYLLTILLDYTFKYVKENYKNHTIILVY